MSEAAITETGGAPRPRAITIKPDGRGCLVRVNDRMSRWYAVRPDVVAARRWLWTLRRVDVVEVGLDGGGCRLSGVGHRQPVTRTVSLATALGLGTLGVPLIVDMVDR